MIEKMKFVNIMGNVNDIERVKGKYISKYDIQMEDAVKELKNTKDLTQFISINPYVEQKKRIEKFAKLVNADIKSAKDITKESAYKIIDLVSELEHERTENIKQLEDEKTKQLNLLEQIKPFTKMDFNIQSLLEFKYIKIRFGRIPAGSYKQLESYLHLQHDILFIAGNRGQDYIWGVYFVPVPIKEKIDAIFSSLHFERIYLSDELVGTPQIAFDSISAKITDLEDTIRTIQIKQSEAIQSLKADITDAYKKIKDLYNYFDMQKYAAKTKDSFYILVGWMPERDANLLAADIEYDEKVVLIIEDEFSSINSKPPTKLNNNFLVKPFEFFVKMYGLPSYNEMDPTLFVAITYSLLFGLMFGDIGQGLVLTTVGTLLYKFKGFALGAIFGIVGLFSVFFGFVFGSVFGFEILEPLWINPMENINTVLITTVAFGIILIIISMFIHILNALKRGDIGSALFDSNGVSGLVFYIAVIISVLFALNGNAKIAGWIIAVFIGIPLLLITFRQPLSNLIKGNKRLIHEPVGSFLLESFFEMFEILLSYMTNSISFVRVGGFALSHAGMMSVVMLLANATSGSPNIFIVIFGNIFVMCMEGLIVGIQVLRLEYYEMFSRFFKGGGREFTPFNKNH